MLTPPFSGALVPSLPLGAGQAGVLETQRRSHALITLSASQFLGSVASCSCPWGHCPPFEFTNGKLAHSPSGLRTQWAKLQSCEAGYSGPAGLWLPPPFTSATPAPSALQGLPALSGPQRLQLSLLCISHLRRPSLPSDGSACPLMAQRCSTRGTRSQLPAGVGQVSFPRLGDLRGQLKGLLLPGPLFLPCPLGRSLSPPASSLCQARRLQKVVQPELSIQACREKGPSPWDSPGRKVHSYIPDPRKIAIENWGSAPGGVGFLSLSELCRCPLHPQTRAVAISTWVLPGDTRCPLPVPARTGWL